MLPCLDDLIPLVQAIAREELLPRFNHAERRVKADGSIVTEADFAVQRRLAEALRQRYPELELLGEEMDPARQRELLGRLEQGLWCLDPLDGTSNFAAGFPFFCISLALLQGPEPVLGLVYDPLRDECFTAQRGRGAWLNGRVLRCRTADLPLSACLAAVDFKRLDPGRAAALACRPPYRSLRYLGSGALEWCWLAADRFQVYLHGRQKLWDYAAGALILTEAGGWATTLEGEPIFAPGLPPRSVVAAGDSRLHGQWWAALAAEPHSGPE
ncbi:inositol monophosphatase family protein [Candidatus Methylocalor cossyra]|uniref:Myo-inositol-1(Or 4)-monophosphatase n=1 Tax=Candidatus Methylocalor cossyra TaxID=3108543 RepID=A0ABM9NHW7_9GAMM